MDGFRVDAVKHMSADDVAAIMGRLSKPVERYYEVIDKGGEPISMTEYTGSGKVLVFSYGDEVGSAFQWGKIATLRNLAGGVDGTVARVFLDNHDTQRHGVPRCSPTNSRGSMRWPTSSCSPGPTASRR